MKLPNDSFLVFAALKWNPSGIVLRAGKRYRIGPVVSGQEWEDSAITCGPTGWRGEIGGISSNALLPLLRVKKVGGNIMRYFALIGCIGRTLENAFLIGDGCTVVAPVDGELFAFANDADFAYTNNHGQIAVAVTLSV